MSVSTDKIRLLIERNADPERSHTNARGNAVRTAHVGSCDRYLFDFKLCTAEKGWRQFDTDQDAHYFGVWVHLEERLTLTYAEGDLTLVECPTPESFRAELDDAASFYGAPPPAMIVLDFGAKTRTDVYDTRPSSADVKG